MLDNLYNLVLYISPYVPYTFVSIFIFSFGLLGFLTYFFNSSLKKVSKPSKAPVPQEKNTDDLVTLKTNRFIYFFSLFGYLPSNYLARSFVQAIQVLRQGIGGIGFRYKLPWFLLLGTEQSGKTTFIQNADLPLPLGNPLAQKPGENRGCDWWFFDRAVVIDVQGSFLIYKNSLNSNEKKWKYFFSLLSHFRVRRPIDGIILTIPITEFLGPTTLDRDTLLDRAREIYNKFKLVETKLGLVIPVYIVITKTDLCKGFKPFAKTLPPTMLQEIFGWSSPYDPEKEFDSTLIDEAFTTIEDTLRSLQIEILSREIPTDLREGLMLFPAELSCIKESLGVYLTNIFQDVGYRQAFFFRGVYFTGDIAWQPSDVDQVYSPDNASSGQQPLSTYGIENTRKIVFIPSLLRDKIFPEYGLARPGKRRLISSSRAINIIRVCMIITFISLGIGIFHAYKYISLTTKDLMPFFNHVETALYKANKITETQGEADEFNSVFFDNKLKSLLLLLTQVENTSVFSIFLPPSWTFFLSKDIQAVLKITYEKIVLRSLYLELLNKIRTTIQEPTAYLDSNIEDIELSQPLQIPEFLILNTYVQQIASLETNIKKYNALSQTKSLTDVGIITQYLFGLDLPESVYKNAAFYEKALQFVNEKPISIVEFKASATARLKRLFGEYVEALFGPNKSYHSLVNLIEVLNSLSSFSLNNLPQQESLASLENSINTIVSALSSPNLSWLDKFNFNPGDAYDALMDTVYRSAFFNSGAGDELTIEINQNYVSFKKKLAAFSSSLTGPLIASQEGKLVIGPSQGLLSLQQAFSSFMSMPFMKPVLDRQFQTDIVAGYHLYWSQPLIEEALNTVDVFDVFLANTLPTYPASIQEILKILGRLHMEKYVTSTIAEAQSFVKAQNNISNFVQEDTLRKQIDNLKNVLPSFSDLFSILSAGDITGSYLHLRSLLNNQIFSLLQDINFLFESEGIFDTSTTSFDTWNGEENPVLQAFGVTDMPSLAAYLNIQRSRTIYIVLEYALPLLNFLETDSSNFTAEDINLLTKWNLITNQVRGYQQKKPHNSITLLQNFILKTLPTVTLANCEQILQNSIMDPDGDYFEQGIENLRTSLLARCEALKGQSALDNYIQIESFFNNRLAGRFPFVGTNPLNYSGYANPADIKAFFNIFSSLSESAKTYLQNSKNLNISRDRAIDFLIAMESVKSFFEGYLTPHQSGTLPSYVFDVTFRVFKDKEQGASQLLDWTFTVGSTSFDLHSSNLQGTWQYGAPVSLSLQWASNGPTQPMEDQKQPDLSVNGYTATFAYTSPWALLELLLKHEAPMTDFSNFVDPNPQTLSFSIPTQGTQTPNHPSSIPANVFMRLTLKTQNKEGDTTVIVPYFPDAAPILEIPSSSKISANISPAPSPSSITTIVHVPSKESTAVSSTKPPASTHKPTASPSIKKSPSLTPKKGDSPSSSIPTPPVSSSPIIQKETTSASQPLSGTMGIPVPPVSSPIIRKETTLPSPSAPDTMGIPVSVTSIPLNLSSSSVYAAASQKKTFVKNQLPSNTIGIPIPPVPPQTSL